MPLAWLCQIDAARRSDGAATVVRVGSHDDDRLCHLSPQTPQAPWWPAIARLPKFTHDFFDGAFGGDIGTPAGQVELSVDAIPGFATLMLHGARIRFWSGELGAAFGAFTLRFDGLVSEQPPVRDGRAAVAFKVDDRWLDDPLLALYTGTTGAEGEAGLKGQVKPLLLGAPRMTEGVLINSVSTIVQLSDGPIAGVDVAMENAARFAAPVADYASYAALDAATIAPGFVATSLAAGLIRHGAPPDGVLTYDVQGSNSGSDGGGQVRRVGAIIKRLAARAGKSAKVDATALTAIDVARPYNVSVALTQQTTLRELAQSLAQSINAVALVTWTGLLTILPVPVPDAATPVGTLASDGSSLPPVADVAQIAIAAPFWRIAIEAEATNRVHSYEEIRFTALLVDRGRYSPSETYREGNIVDMADGSYWRYTSLTPSSGNMPVSGSTYWVEHRPATDRGKLFVQAAAPTAAESNPGDSWQTPDGTYYSRTDGPIGFGGNSLAFGTNELMITWAIKAVQPVTAVAAVAAAAQNAAITAQATADLANGKLAEIASDSLLTPGEKPQVILERDTLVAEQAGIDAQATAFGITTEKTAYDNAVAALVAYLATLTTPVPWNDLNGNSDIVGTVFRAKFGDVYAARQTLLNKVAAVAKAQADAAAAAATTAQGTANSAASNAALANAILAEIASDSLLTPGEKPQVIRDRDVIVAEQAGIDASAAAFGITTQKTAYDNAVSALTTYLATLTTPFLWSNVAGNTDIVGATFRSKFADVYTTRQALLDKIAAEAALRASWGGISGPGKPEDGADVTANAQVAVVPPGDFTLSRTWDGIMKAGQLPIDKSPVVTRGGVDKRTDNGTSYAIVTATGGLAGGKVSINNINGSADKGTLTFADTIESGGLVGFTVAIGGVTYGPFVINVTTVDDNAPINNGASGGIDSSLAMVSNTTYSVMTGTDTGDPVLDVVITGPTQTLKLWAAFSYFKGGGGSLAMTCTAEYYNGSAWVSMGAEVTGSLAQRYFDGDLETWVMEAGALSYAWSVTGLAAGTYPVRLLGKKATSTTGTLTPATGKVTSSRV